MIKKFKKVSKLFFAWQDEKEEIWLREMAKKGWLLKRYNILYYTFEKCEPKDYIYKLDYKSTSNSDMDEYIKIFEDTGWDHCDQYLGWHYFRTEAKNAKTPDIYSDTNSKIQKYSGLLRTLLVVVFISFITSIGIVFDSSYDGITVINILRVSHIILFLLSGYGISKIFFKIKKLKSDI